jgi:hypothetical protein
MVVLVERVLLLWVVLVEPPKVGSVLRLAVEVAVAQE